MEKNQVARRPMRRAQTPTPATKVSPESAKEEPVKEESAAKSKDPVVAVIILGCGLVHPCGTRLLPNSPTEIPDDNWTKAQMNAGILRIQ